MKIKLPWKRGCKDLLSFKAHVMSHWIHLAQDSDKQRDLMNTTKNLRVTYKELKNLD
jgi:hypothetical protein